MQVGYVGLLKAINNFNPEIGDSLTAYAAPCISGEIKRHFRDKRWQVHVRRPIQELVLARAATAGPAMVWRADHPNGVIRARVRVLTMIGEGNPAPPGLRETTRP